MTYDEALEYIHSVSWRGSRLGLSRTLELLERVGNPQKHLKFVHVAGTNGKGSTCACIEAILRHAGYRTGLYTSPYIIRFNERIRVCGKDISDDDLCRLVEQVRNAADDMEDKPTEFEFITVLGFLHFLQKKCDIVVLEVGLGGELDSTNVIDPPEVAVITAIGLDHTRELGGTLKKIAAAKAGIIKEGSEAVMYGFDLEVSDVIKETCRKKGVQLNLPDFSKIEDMTSDLVECKFSYDKYRNIVLPLAGTYQPKNAVMAITACECLRKRGWKISDNDITEGLSEVKWPGRFELLGKNPVFILDGSHNPHGMAATAESLRSNFGDKKLVFLTGIMADKDVHAMITLIAPMAKRFVTVAPDNPRALSAEEYAKILRENGLEAEAEKTIEDGVKAAINLAGKDGVVCALGSLYFSADIRSAFNKLI